MTLRRTECSRGFRLSESNCYVWSDGSCRDCLVQIQPNIPIARWPINSAVSWPTYYRALFSTRAIIIHTSLQNCYRNPFIVAIDQLSRPIRHFTSCFIRSANNTNLSRWNINNFRHITVASEFIEFTPHSVGAAWWNFIRRILAYAPIINLGVCCTGLAANALQAGIYKYLYRRWLELALNCLRFVCNVIIQCFRKSVSRTTRN